MATQRNDRRPEFVRQYLVDLCATQAAIRAGYSPRRASVTATALMKMPEIQKAIAEAMAERVKRTEITADMVLRELAKIGFSNMADYITTSESGSVFVSLCDMTRDQAAAVSEITVEEYMEGRGENAREVKRTKFKLSDKRAALCDIGKHLGMFREDKGGEDLPPPTRVVVEVVDGRKSDGD